MLGCYSFETNVAGVIIMLACKWFGSTAVMERCL